MKYLSLLALGLLGGAIIVGGSVMLGVRLNEPQRSSVGKVIVLTPTPTYPPMEKYSFESLINTPITPHAFEIGEKIQETKDSASFVATIGTPDGDVSGMLNIPGKAGTYPIIIMFRGFVDQSIYETGAGTRHAGEVLAQNGYITFAPDFLGFGESDMPSAVPLEERFQRYTTGLTILESVTKLNDALATSDYADVAVDSNKVGIWGHSNGGHIALAMLAITGRQYPTTLWAPVSKPFPYSILYYTDEFDDGGRALRAEVAEFENHFNSDEFSVTNYEDRITAPIILHQGTSDDAVPVAWSNTLAARLKTKDVDITYYTYDGDDHNFSKGSWEKVVERDMEFFEKYFKNV